jgi:hypothetical protein
MYPKVPSPLIQNAILHDSELFHQVYIPRSYVSIVLTKPLVSLSVFKLTAFNITSLPKIYRYNLSPFPPFKPAYIYNLISDDET